MAAGVAVTTMTEPTGTPRWDAPPTEPLPAVRAPGRTARPASAAADGPEVSASSPAAERPAASAPRVDHDAPTAKLPALPRDAARKREPIKRPGPFPVIAGSAGLFFAVAALLAFQMRAGADPALGAGEPQVVAQATPAPRKVLIRRVIVTRIVEFRPRRDDGGPAPATPRSTSSAPAPAAPARAAPAPAAPAPAPAPLTTQSS
jgi:hypothetical protein